MAQTQSRWRCSTALALLIAVGTACGTDGGSAPTNVDALGALPYVNSSPSSASRLGQEGVRHHDRRRSHAGLNLRPIQSGFGAELFDMDGQILHRWQVDDLFAELRHRLPEVERWWEHVVLDADGNLICEADHTGMAKLGWDSKVQWVLPMLVHHEIELADNGDIYTFLSRPTFLRDGGRKLLLVDNPIAIVSSEGKLEKTVSYLPALMRERRLKRLLLRFLDEFDGVVEPADLERVLRDLRSASGRARRKIDDAELAWLRGGDVLDRVRRMVKSGDFDGSAETFFALRLLGLADPLHANTLRILDRHPGGLWDSGDLLISLRNLHLVFVIDPEARRLKWYWGPGEVTWQHYPFVLESENILIFDNGREWSRLIEVDPRSGKIVWQYEGNPRESFFSSWMGAAHPQPNGNILVTDSMQGRGFEITREGETVWEWYAPTRGDRHEVVYRLDRYDGAFVRRLERPSKAGSSGPRPPETSSDLLPYEQAPGGDDRGGV